MSIPRDVVFTYSLETLEDSRDRGFARPPGRMLQTLLQNQRVGRILVVDAERSLLSILHHGRSTWPQALGPPRPRLRPWRWRRLGPTEPAAVERQVRRTDATIAKAVERHGLNDPALVTFDPLMAGFAPATWAHSVTYYGRDDWASYPPRQAWWPAYEAAYAELRARHRAVLAISHPLIELISPTGPHAVVPNGIDPDEWRRPGSPPAWFGALDRPRYTYVGTIDDRVDEALVAQLRELDGTVVLLGPCPDPARRSRLTALGAKLGEASGRAELSAIVHASDVGLIPHSRSSLTAAMSPLKLYEYRAAGLPVASVDLPPIAAEAADDQRIVLATVHTDGFAIATRRALEIGSDDEADRQDYIERTSWAGRHTMALEIALR